jgi:granule-bound starch synthase
MSISPRYDQYSDAWDTGAVADVGGGETVRFFHARKRGVDRVFVDHPSFLAKVWGKTGGKIYGSRSGADYLDNPRRFSLFCKAALAAIGSADLPFAPGPDAEGVVVVANDWHSALVPVLVKEAQKGGSGASPAAGLKGAKTALVVHNVAFQGRFFRDAFADMALPASTEPLFAFEDGYSVVYDEANPMDDDAKPFDNAGGRTFGKINWLKAGVLTADELLTVSPAYAAEIAEPGKGVELDQLVRARGGAVGIVNGMDVEEWDPATDKLLDVNYGPESVHAGKAAAKAALQAELGLPVDPGAPLFGVIGRLEEQKGTDILLSALPSFPPNAQVAILGTGKAKYEAMLKAAGKLGPNVKAVVQFSAPLAHQINAGADFLIVPSRFEPCGLIQLHAMRYGAVPIVASTGGLIDTVQEGRTGFHIGALNPDALDAADVGALAATVARAAQVFTRDPAKHRAMVEACVAQDLSWAAPARKWEGVLEAMRAGGSAKASAKAGSVKTPVEAL